jgi:Uncharacterised nucleotidyltransferase
MSRTEFDARAYATAVARYGLDGAEPPPEVADEDWSLALATLAEEKILGIACAAANDGWLPLGEDHYDELVGRQREAMAWCLGLERRLLQLADAFDSVGLDFVVLKGPAVAHTVYPDPSWRTFNDLDLLVRTSQWRVALRMLEDGFGWPRRLPEPRRGFDERFGKAAVFTTQTGQQIDLHRNLAQGPFCVWIDTDELFERTMMSAVGGTVLKRLDATAMFVHTCIHAILGDPRPRLLQCRDIVETAAGPVDQQALSAIVPAWRLGSVVERAGVEASLLDGGSTRRRIGLYPSGAAERRAFAAYTAGKRSSGEVTLATIRAIPGLRAKARYMRDLAFPGREFAHIRGAGRWQKAFGWFAPGGTKERLVR